jgi:hypothetical protein
MARKTAEEVVKELRKQIKAIEDSYGRRKNNG